MEERKLGHLWARLRALEEPLDVLVVENNIPLGSLVRLVLEDMGVKVRLAINLADGRDSLSERRPDILWLDVNLPDGMGTDLLPLLGQFPPPMIVIASGHMDREEVAEAMRSGPCMLLPKPYQIEDIQRVIKSLELGVRHAS